ncbi:MAG: hypothetical protein QGG64_03755 [Candidatus Latescibacteria bacterium]|jgi:hypothetical protein|nr:hypothetical protein [Candidatus Latescibacterota bacterium]
MNDLKQNAIPLSAFFLTGITAILAYDHVPYPIPYIVFKYPFAITIIYVFFRFVAISDKRRSNQLDEVGLFRPLRDGAFLLCGHAHLLDLGSRLGILSPASNIYLGLLSWIIVMIGLYARRQPQGLLGRLLDLLPITTPQTRTFLCNGFIIAGILGVIGTFAALVQPLWLSLPLAYVFFRAWQRSGDHS